MTAVRIEVLRVRRGRDRDRQRQNGEQQASSRSHVISLDARGPSRTPGELPWQAMPFFQEPPTLGNQYTADKPLRAYLERTLPDDMRRAIEPELAEMGELSGGRFFELDRQCRGMEPRLTQWDAWGHRVDTIELTPLWEEAARVAAEKGVVATAYERKHGELSRIHQFALAYLFDGSTEVYSCPLAMTDGAAKTLQVHGNRELVGRALPRLLSRDPARAWTSGQWMTERTGGSDVAISETVARKDGEAWRLYGTKWLTSATTSQMALTLGRPEGNAPGGQGLALFYVETRDGQGRLKNGIQINRLKDKLGTRMVPTAELTLDGVEALPVVGMTDGIKHIAPMLNVTRTWNAIGACVGMRRGLALARDYARKRVAFGAPLMEKPLHVDTLAGCQAELEGALLLTFRAVALLGKEEAEDSRRGGRAAPSPPDPHRQGDHREAGGGGGQRGPGVLRRRRLRRGHRAAADPARRPGAAHLGGDDQRAFARSDAGAEQIGDARAGRARGEAPRGAGA